MKKLPPWAVGLVGIVAIIGVWWIAALVSAPVGGKYAPIPAPPQVIVSIVGDGFAFFWKAFSVTLTEAGIGFLWGNVIALVLSAFVLVVPRAEGVLNQIAVITYCVPIVSVGTIAIIILGGSKTAGGPSATAIFLAALSVFFTTVVGTLLGLKAADRASLDVVTVYGGSRFTALRKVAFPASLPAFFAAVKISVPGAITGALLVEWLATGQGIGYGIISAAGRAKFNEVWADVVVITAVSIVLYNVVAIIESVVLARRAR